MFEHLSELKKATIRQKVALNAMMVVGCVWSVDYGENGTLIVDWDDGDYGLSRDYVIDKKGNVNECIIDKKTGKVRLFD